MQKLKLPSLADLGVFDREKGTTPEITSALEECATVTKLAGIPFILNLANADNKRRANNARTPVCVFNVPSHLCAFATIPQIEPPEETSNCLVHSQK